jgi:hypothetical protein
MGLNANAFVTVNDLTDAGLTGETAYLEALINRASSLIEKYIGRSIKSATYIEEYDGNHTGMIALKNYPLTAITSVETITGEIGDPDYDSLDTDEYSLLNKDTDSYSQPGIIRIARRYMGHDRYRITYTAGYATVPEDLKQACVDLCGFLSGSAKSSGVKSETLGEYSITYGNTGDPITSSGIKFVLDMYRTPSV